MLNMNLSTIGLAVCGCLLYVYAMSALGRWLAGCREESTVVYIVPPSQRTLGA
jgi:hypothetical protein